MGFHGVFMIFHAAWSRNARVWESKLMVWPGWQEPTENAYFGKDFTDLGVQKAVFSRLRRLRIAIYLTLYTYMCVRSCARSCARTSQRGNALGRPWPGGSRVGLGVTKNRLLG